jgi:hypothetical protein
MAFRPAYRVLAPLAALAAALTLTATAQAAAPGRTAQGTEITVASTAFGRALAVGSGPFKNRSLYFISSDNPPGYGCTTGVTKTLFGQAGQGRLLQDRGMRPRLAAGDHRQQGRRDRRADLPHRRDHHHRPPRPGDLERPPAIPFRF